MVEKSTVSDSQIEPSAIREQTRTLTSAYIPPGFSVFDQMEPVKPAWRRFKPNWNVIAIIVFQLAFLAFVFSAWKARS